MKMRALVAGKKRKLKAIGTMLAQNGSYAVDVIPPSYPCDRERLVVIIATVRGSMPDAFRRFCQELSKEKAQNVALIIDGNETNAAMVADWIKSAGTNVIDNILYFPVGFFAGLSKSLSAEETAKINAWYEEVNASLR